MSSQNQKTIFITSSSSALGGAPAKLFASKGWEVIATMRSPDKETELDKQMETYSSPEQIAEAVYEAATDGKDQLRYVAGEDAKATYAMRLQVGVEAFRQSMSQRFFGN